MAGGRSLMGGPDRQPSLILAASSRQARLRAAPPIQKEKENAIFSRFSRKLME